MLLWPAMALIGFLVLTAMVIVMGTTTTARYEREQLAERSPAGRNAVPEPLGAASA